MMARASGRFFFSADTTSSPLPSPSRRSTTAKAGALLPICASPSATLSQEVTAKPRVSIARESRSRNGLSSSTIKSERSAWSASSAVAKVGNSSGRTAIIWRLVGALPRSQNCAPVNAAERRSSGSSGVGRAFFARIGGRGPGFQQSALGGRRLAAVLGFEQVARPGDLDHSAVIWENAVVERNRCAGALQQRTGNKHAEPEAAVVASGLVLAPPPRQIGFADPLQDVGGKARPVVGNHDLHRLLVPPGVDLDGGAREIDGVLENVADAVKDCGIPPAYRLLASGNRDPDLYRHAEFAVRCHRLLDQRRQLHPVERRAGRG